MLTTKKVVQVITVTSAIYTAYQIMSLVNDITSEVRKAAKRKESSKKVGVRAGYFSAVEKVYSLDREDDEYSEAVGEMTEYMSAHEDELSLNDMQLGLYVILKKIEGADSTIPLGGFWDMVRN